MMNNTDAEDLSSYFEAIVDLDKGITHIMEISGRLMQN